MQRLLLLACIVMAACSGADPKPAQQPEQRAEPEPEHDMYVPPTGLSGPPDAPGKLPMSDVEQVMVDVVDVIKACAAATTYEGKVSVRVTIEPDGHASAELTQASNEPEIDDCMVGAFGEARFPSSERGQRFVYSYRF